MRTLRGLLVLIIGFGALLDELAPGGAASGTARTDDLRIVTLNILHGILCHTDTADCQADDRVQLLGRHVREASCPPVLALEEISDRMYERVRNARWVRDCDYDVVWHRMPGPDRELVLTTLPVKSQSLTILAGDFRGAYRVELRSKLGPVVLVVTHQDGDPTPDEPPEPCTAKACPPPCTPTDSIPACQTIQAEQLASTGGGRRAIRVLTGDFNVTATTDRYRSLVDDGWIDSHLAARNGECDPATGVNCTSGRRDLVLDDLKNSGSKETERIDFIFVKTPKGCRATFDRASDRDHDGLGTGLFAHEPAASGPGGIVYVSDHVGTAADISCR